MLSLLMSTAIAVSMAATADPTTVSGVEVKAPANSTEKLICKTTPMPGTRLGGKRVCAPKSEWDSRAAEAKQDLMNNQARTETVRGN